MWILFILVGTISAGFVILSLLKKFQNNPTITGLNTDFDNWDVPFPAIILCLNYANGISKNISNVSVLPENSTTAIDSNIGFLEDLSHLTLNSFPEFIEKYSDMIDMRQQLPNVKKAIIEFQNDCTEVFANCIFKAEPFNCCNGNGKGFSPVFTENGFCYSFNSRHFEKSNFADTQFNMQYIKETDRKWSLQFSMKANDVVSSLYILDANEMIGTDVQPQFKWQNFEIDKISFSVKQTETTDDTRQLSIKQRRCIFDDEIKLKVNHLYSYTSCTLQCRMENSLRECGCVLYFYPNILNFPYCSLDQFQCIANNLDKIKQINHCQCQLSCNHTVYEIEALNFISEQPEIDSIEIEFDSWPMVRYQRQVIFGWVDLLVSFGGVAGLFLGSSLLSAVEIIYYFTIRTFVSANDKWKIDRKKNTKKLLKSQNTIISVIPYNFPSEQLPKKQINFSNNPTKKNKMAINSKYHRHDNIAFRSIEIGGKLMAEKRILPPFGIEFIN